MKRKFEQHSVLEEGRIVWVQRITCHECPDQNSIDIRSAGDQMPPEAVAHKARQKGWHVGSRPNRDRCPDCIGTRHHQQEDQTKQTPINHGSNEKDFASQLRAADAVASLVKPARARTKEEAQLIFTAVQEAWRGSEHGYKGGVSDDTLATELGLPRVWIAEIRDQFFGPAIVVDPRLEALDHRYTDLEGRARKIVEDTATFMSDLQTFRMDLNALKKEPK